MIPLVVDEEVDW